MTNGDNISRLCELNNATKSKTDIIIEDINNSNDDDIIKANRFYRDTNNRYVNDEFINDLTYTKEGLVKFKKTTIILNFVALIFILGCLMFMLHASDDQEDYHFGKYFVNIIFIAPVFGVILYESIEYFRLEFKNEVKRETLIDIIKHMFNVKLGILIAESVCLFIVCFVSIFVDEDDYFGFFSGAIFIYCVFLVSCWKEMDMNLSGNVPCYEDTNISRLYNKNNDFNIDIIYKNIYKNISEKNNDIELKSPNKKFEFKIITSTCSRGFSVFAYIFIYGLVFLLGFINIILVGWIAITMGMSN